MKFNVLKLMIVLLWMCSMQPFLSNAITPQAKQVNSIPIKIYKNLENQQLLSQLEYDEFLNSLKVLYSDTISSIGSITQHYQRPINSGDTIIQPFSYDVRVGTEYKVRARKYDKIGVYLPPRIFGTVALGYSLSDNPLLKFPVHFDGAVDKDSVQIGGIQEKPTLVNLWFIGCGGCVAEIPALNRLKEKYKDDLNFIAITFDAEERVKGFLKKKPFNFIHVADPSKRGYQRDLRSYLKYLGTYPYPENIFIDKKGIIRFIEGGMAVSGNLDNDIHHFELIIKELLKEE